jgi:hypothetical protein
MASASGPPVNVVPLTMPTSRVCVAVASPSASTTFSENDRLVFSVPLLAVTKPMSEILMTSLSVVAAPNDCVVVLAPPVPVTGFRLIALPVTPSVDTSSWAPSIT